MVKILKTEKIAQQMITSKYAFQKNDPVNYPLSENETSMGAAGINELLRACNTKPRELTERLWALDQKSMRLTAIAMAAHPRLGACSPLAMMDADLIQEIVRLCGR